MIKNFDELFSEFLGRRTEEFYDLYVANKKYIKANNITVELYRKLENILDKKQMDLFVNYDERRNYFNSVFEELIYSKGVKDGFNSETSNYENVSSQEYKRENNKVIKTYEKVEKVLNKEQLELLEEYYEVCINTDIIIHEVIYKQGLKDGKTLKEILIDSDDLKENIA